MFPPNFTNKKYQPPGHEKVPEHARVGTGGHILVGKCSWGGELLPPGHKKVPERTWVGNREEPGEGERVGAGAKGNKKGSIRGGVLPYVGEGR